MKMFEALDPIIPKKDPVKLEEERKKQAQKNNKMRSLFRGAQSRH